MTDRSAGESLIRRCLTLREELRAFSSKIRAQTLSAEPGEIVHVLGPWPGELDTTRALLALVLWRDPARLFVPWLRAAAGRLTVERRTNVAAVVPEGLIELREIDLGVVRPITIIAEGGGAKEVLAHLREAADNFDASLFDSDGYLKSGGVPYKSP